MTIPHVSPVRAQCLAPLGVIVLLLSCAFAESNPYASDVAPQPESEIDQLVLSRLAELSVRPPNLCTDAVFVREMLTANGSNFRVGQVNFYRAVQDKEPKGLAQAVALTFMGERADKWPADN